jgi:hypothetical protein
MASKRSKEKSPVWLAAAPMRNVYEETESDRSEQEVLGGWDDRGPSHKYGDGWRHEKKKRTEYDSDVDPYESPRSECQEERKSPHARLNDDMGIRRGRRECLFVGSGTSKVRRHRSRSLELYYRIRSIQSGQRRTSNDRQVRHQSWYSDDSPGL